jgi:peptidoglycan/LPS O-acetylase OafA/YrhL
MRPIDTLTSARGFAAWWIVLFHFQDPIDPLVPQSVQALIARGYLAVDFFFVLSGFVIALNYLAGFRTVTGANVAHFLRLRFARIYPLHIVMLCAFLTIPAAILLASTQKAVDSQFDPAYFGLSVLLVQNWGFTSTLGWNVPAWSISTETAAYLLFPLVAWLTLRWATTGGRALLACSLCLLTVAAVFAITGNDLGGAIPQLGLIRCLAEFQAGLFLYRAWSLRGRPGAVSAWVALAVAAGLITVVLAGAAPDFLVFPSACVLAIYALTCERAAFCRVLAWRPFVLVGELSYSTYMLHYFAKTWIKFLLVGRVPDAAVVLVYFAATAAGSVVLYGLIEVPSRRFLRRPFWRHGRRERSAEGVGS